MEGHTEKDAQVYTDEHAGYKGINRPHEAVAHGAGEYVREMACTNGLESHWALFKRGLDGIYHHVSVKHLGRYAGEFAGRHNDRPMDTADQMKAVAKGNGRQAFAVRRPDRGLGKEKSPGLIIRGFFCFGAIALIYRSYSAVAAGGFQPSFFSRL